MEKLQFDTLFEIEVANKSGFLQSGKSLYFKNDMHTIGLIRLGGRMSVPGGISHVLCCRHSFLRNMDQKISEKHETEVFAYPIKMKPSEIKKGLFGLNVKYQPQNLKYGYEVFKFSDKSDEEVKRYLAHLSKTLTVVREWFVKQPPSKLASEISSNGTNAWIEKLWIEDYERMAI